MHSYCVDNLVARICFSFWVWVSFLVELCTLAVCSCFAVEIEAQTKWTGLFCIIGIGTHWMCARCLRLNLILFGPCVVHYTLYVHDVTMSVHARCVYNVAITYWSKCYAKIDKKEAMNVVRILRQASSAYTFPHHLLTHFIPIRILDLLIKSKEYINFL